MEVRKAPAIARLSASELFDNLEPTQRICLHHLARAAWLGTRIILQQVSPEASSIFDFIVVIHQSCDGNYQQLRKETGLSDESLSQYLLYAATFLQNVGNYYGHGDQKFVPACDQATFKRLSKVSDEAARLYESFASLICSAQPHMLGYASQTSQTSYYLGEVMSAEEIALVTETMEMHSLSPEHTRIRKSTTEQGLLYEVLYASIEKKPPTELQYDGSGRIQLVSGDFCENLVQICEELNHAIEYAVNPRQKEYLSILARSLHAGNMQEYKESQELWVQDQAPIIETIFGFVEPYRDPYGVRAEFEGVVGIVDQQETQLLNTLIESAHKFIPSLPWVMSNSEGLPNGPFEGTGVGHRDFSSVHTLVYCSSLIFPGVNLPNFNDIRQKVGFKNIMIGNRIDGAPMSGDAHGAYVEPKEVERFMVTRRQAYYLWVVFHELFGHGTGRFLEETERGVYNFDTARPPVNPVTNKPITSWYRFGQTFTGVFGDIATRVDECRAECVGAILLSNVDLMALCGITASSSPSLSEIEYTSYIQLAVGGLRSLENYSPEEKKWGQAHSQGHFAMFRALLEQGEGLFTVHHAVEPDSLYVVVDREKVATHGKPIIEELALRLHVYRCTADVKGCRSYFDDLTQVSSQHLAWRKIVMANKPPSPIFVQPNTILDGKTAVLKEYEPTVEGVIQSWVERNV